MAKAYTDLEVGYEFPPGNYKFDAPKVVLFLEAVEDSSYPYQDNRLVPPMAVAALAMASLSNTISLPPGAVHTSQELNFLEAVTLDENLTSYAKLSRTQKRGKLHLITVDFSVRNQSGKSVVAGRTSFILPQTDEGK